MKRRKNWLDEGKRQRRGKVGWIEAEWRREAGWSSDARWKRDGGRC